MGILQINRILGNAYDILVLGCGFEQGQLHFWSSFPKTQNVWLEDSTKSSKGHQIHGESNKTHRNQSKATKNYKKKTSQKPIRIHQDPSKSKKNDRN